MDKATALEAVSGENNGQEEEEEDLDTLLALDESLSGDGLLSNRYHNASTLSDDMQQLFLQSPTTITTQESPSQTASAPAAATAASTISSVASKDTPAAKMFLSPQQQQHLSSPPLSSSSFGMTADATTGQSAISPTTFLNALLLDSNDPPTQDHDSKEQTNLFLAPPPLFTIDDDDERLAAGMDDLESLFSISTEVVDVVVPKLHNNNDKHENLSTEHTTPDKAAENVETEIDSSATTEIPFSDSDVRVAAVQDTRESSATGTAASFTISTTCEIPKKSVVAVELDASNKNVDPLMTAEKRATTAPRQSSLFFKERSVFNDDSETLPLFSSKHSPAGDEEQHEQQQHALDFEPSNVPIVSPSHPKSLMVMVEEEGLSSFGGSMQESIIASDWTPTDDANEMSQQGGGGGGGGADSSLGSVDKFPETASSEDFHSFVTAREDDGDNSTLASKEQYLAASHGDDDDNAYAVSLTAFPLLEQSYSADRQPGDWSIEEDDPTTPKRSGRELLCLVDSNFNVRAEDNDAIDTAEAAAFNESTVGPGTQPDASTKDIFATASASPSLESSKPTLLVPLLEQDSESTSMRQDVVATFPALKAADKESELKFISRLTEDSPLSALPVLGTAAETIGVAVGPPETVEKKVEQNDYGGRSAECPSDEVSWKSSSQPTELLPAKGFVGLATKLAPADTLLETSRYEEDVVGEVTVEIAASILGLDEKKVRNESQTNEVGLSHSTKKIADALVLAPAVVHKVELAFETNAIEAEEEVAAASLVFSSFPPPVAEESPIAFSPLPSQQFKESQQFNDVFRPMRKQPKSLQVEFPSVLDRSLKKSDVSLSSASSTISHGSFTRGLATSGMSSPYNAEDMLRRARGDAVHPRSPKKVSELNESPKSFADSLSKRLAVRENLTDDSENVETKWIKQSIPLSFNPKKSIFASNLDAAKCPDISPPGSPPEPIYSDYDDDGDSLNDESRGNSSGGPELNPEAGTWDMMSDDADDRNRPDFVVLPEPGSPFLSPPIESADDLCTESSLAPSEAEIDRDKQFKHSTNQMKSFLNTSSSFTTAIKHRGMTRALSFVSRGSGRHSVSSGKSRGRGRSNRDPKITTTPIVRCEEARTMPSRRADSETVSLGGRSSSPPPRLPLGNLFHGTHQSSPDLQRLAEQRGAIKPVSPMNLLVSDRVTQTPEIVGKEPLISDVQYSDIISPDTLNGRFTTLNDSDSVEAEHKSALLEEELLAFSSFRRIDLPFRYTSPLESFDYVGSVQWRQLVACWKHSEMTRAMMTRAPSPHFIGASDTDKEDETWCGDSSCHRRETSVGDLELHGALLKANQVRSGTSNFDGFVPLHREFRLSTITRFLSKVGGLLSQSSGQNLCQELSSDSSITVQSLLSAAESNTSVLSSVVEDIVAFASIKSTARGELTDGAIRFVVGVKDRQAMERKAERKYCGNIFQVKDILRAQITFAEEGELVCGLVRLFQITGLLEGGGNGSCLEIKLVRIKNLFFSESLLVDLPVSPLPTGYRHLLLNIRLKNGLLSEIQFNLSSLFDVLGHEGHLLHRELVELKHAFDTREKYTKTISSFDINDLISEAYTLSSPKNSLFEAFSSIPVANSGAAMYAATFKEGGTIPSSPTPQGYDDGDTPQTKDFHTENSTKDVTLNFESSAQVLSASSLTGATSVSMGDNDRSKVAAAVPSASFTAQTSANSLRDLETPTTGQSSVTGKSRGGEGSDEKSRGVRTRLLDEISVHRGVLSGGDLFLSVLQHGCNAAAHNPRDVATFYCLYILFSYIVKRENDVMLSSLGFGVQKASDVSDFAQQCLLRCLKISNQAISTGMNGWLEYGCSSALDRLTERPFVVLRHLAYDLGRRNKWGDAECVLLALVVRCEQYLPLYHPTTLTSLLDLAVASSMVGKTSFAERIVSRAADRLSTYLTEMEHNYLSHLSLCSSGGKHGDTVFRIEHGRDAIFMLHAFVSLFQSHLSRDIFTLVGSENEIILTNHCFLADALSVLANCSAAARCLLSSASDSSHNDGAQYWQLAFTHYQRAFDGFARTKGLDDPSVARAAFGLARCLREFGESEKALQLLSLVVSYTEKTAAATSSVDPIEETKIDKEEPKKGLVTPPRFLPRSLNSKTSSDKIRASKHTSSARCLWLMAILSLDQAPNEEGRERAFSYLHAASVSLQSILNRLSDVDHGPTRSTCIQFLAMIEDEALQISEPVFYE